jgi:S-adenosylmethionine hydrolase
MPIITLTTDLGERDIYQAVIKGNILKLLPTANIVDITNSVSAFNIQQAAFILKNSFYYFPELTVHLMGVDTVNNTDTRYLAVKYKNHYFVGADNGIFSLMFDDEPEEIVELNLDQDFKFLHFPLADIFVKASCHLAQNGALTEIGLPVSGFEKKMNLQPVIEKNLIKGGVIFIDSYQNVITNITKDFFNKVQNGRRFRLSFKRNETIDQLSWHYNEVPEGEKLCLFGISNHLEIAINKGNASGLLGLALGDSVIIEFFDTQEI